MNRRSFLKALFALPLAALVPPERNNMEIGNILKKMGASTLTHAEQEAIRLWGNQLQQAGTIVSGIQNGTADIHVNTIVAKQGEFGFVPTEAIYVGTNTITLSNNVETDVTFGATTPRKSYFFSYDPSSPTKISVIRPTWHLAIGYGTITFAQSATGIRVLRYVTYNASDVEVGGLSVLIGHGSSSGGLDIFPVVFNVGLGDTVSYFKFKITQTSGGNLDYYLNFTFAMMK